MNTNHRAAFVSAASLSLLLLGAIYFALWLWHPNETTFETPLLTAAVLHLFPALLYFLAAIVFRVQDWHLPKLRDPALLFGIAGVLYLSFFITVQGRNIVALLRIRDLHFATLSVVPCFLFVVLFLSFAYAQAHFSSRQHAASMGTGIIRFPSFLSRAFLKVAFILRPWWLLPLGIVLVLSSFALNISDGTGLLVVRRYTVWITAIPEVTAGITIIQFTKKVLGLTIYLLGLTFAIVTAVIFSVKTLRISLFTRAKLLTVFAAIAAFLAVFAAFDLSFGWMGFIINDHPRSEHLVTFGLWLVSWILASLGLVQSLASRRSNSSQIHHWLYIMVMPALLFDAVMAPVLLGQDTLIYLPGLVSWVGGLQLIWWGYLQSFSRQAGFGR